MKYDNAMRHAETVLRELSPFCTRIEVAGSLRRRRPNVGDIEVCCIPKTEKAGLFGDMVIRSPMFCQTVKQWRRIRGHPEDKYTRRIIADGVELDLFICTPDNWGLNFAIRTGSAEWVKRHMADKWSRMGYHSKHAILRRDGESYPLKEEKDVFEFLGLYWVQPEDREV